MNSNLLSPAEEARTQLPLVVDLDGTLTKTDLLIESCLALLKRNPLYVLLLPLWLLRGKAVLKTRIAERVPIDASCLPFHPELLSYLREEKSRGRHLYLATASHRKYAEQVAAHLGLFDTVYATDGEHNLDGLRKCSQLLESYGEKGFDYAGNASPDLRIWPHARHAIVVNARAGVARAARRMANVTRVLDDRSRSWLPYLRALRPHQWVKNVLVLVPLLASHSFGQRGVWLSALLAFAAFSLTASSVYVLNDLLDLESDRHHPRKRLRPFASGDVPVQHGLAIVPLLLIGAVALASHLPGVFMAVLAGYYVVTLGYSLKLKHYAMVDVLTLAGLYTLRVIAGAAALAIMPSFWLLAFSMFMFLSLALVKRYSELMAMKKSGHEKTRGRGYEVGDLTILQSAGLASGYIAVLVLALYVNSPDIGHLYGRPVIIWLVCPLLLLWLSRIWMITHRGDMDDDPIVFAFRDGPSIAAGVLAAFVVFLAL